MIQIIDDKEECIKTTATNCLVFDTPTNCLLCKNTHPVYDINSGNCDKNPEISYCNIYRTPSACEECDPLYYLNKDECFQVVIEIENCLKY